jgi:hypothetical protein
VKIAKTGLDEIFALSGAGRMWPQVGKEKYSRQVKILIVLGMLTVKEPPVF